MIVGPAITVADIHAERDRRLAAGFDFDFGDARGVHRIGTTPADMIGWDEVTKLATAAINLGAPAHPITILTDTGAAQITAQEWQSIIVAAGAVQQPIWLASFALAAMVPLPADFTDDAWWAAP